MTRSRERPADLKPFIIGIGGLSGSGKSALAEALACSLGTESATVVPVDAYYRDLSTLSFEQRCTQNFDAPEAIDWDLLRGHLSTLAAGESVEQPCYDFATHTRKTESQRIDPTPFTIVEGILALHSPQLRRLFDLSVYVTAPEEVCLARRIDRDTRERGRTRESVVRQYEETVAPMARAYVLPTREHAHVVVDGEGSLQASVATIHSRLRAESAAL